MRFFLLCFCLSFTANTNAQSPIWTYEPPENTDEFFQGPIDVKSVSFSPDGKLIASGGSGTWSFSPDSDPAINIFDAETGREILSFAHEHWQVRSIAFSPDGKTLASGGTKPEGHGVGNLYMWDVNTGQELDCKVEFSDWVYSVAFSPDGTMLAVGSSHDEGISLIDVSKCEVIHEFSHDSSTGDVQSVDISPDGTMLVSGSSHSYINLWDLNSKQRIAGTKLLGEFGDEITSVAFSPDGTNLVFAGRLGVNGIIHLWDVNTWEEISTITTETGLVTTVSFSPDGTVLASGTGSIITDGNDIHLWDLDTGEEIQYLSAEDVGSRSVAFSPDGSNLVSGGEANIKLWDAQTLSLIYTIEEDVIEDIKLEFLGFSSDATRLISVQSDGIIRIIDVNTGQEIQEISEFSWEGTPHTISPDGTKLVSVRSIFIYLYDLSSGEQIQQFIGHTKEVNSVEFSPNGSLLLSGADDQVMRLWDVKTGREIQVFSSHDEEVSNVKFFPDGKKLVSGTCAFSDDYTGSIRIWDVTSGDQIQQFLQNTCVLRMIISPDGKKLASSGLTRSVSIWENIESPSPTSSIDFNDGIPTVLSFSLDATKLVVGEDSFFFNGEDSFFNSDISLLDVTSGFRIATIATFNHGSEIINYVVSRDGNFLATGGEKSIKLWNTVPSTVSNEDEQSSPEPFSIIGNYPNPFQSSTSIRLDLPTSARVGVEVFDVTGRRVFMQAPVEINAGKGRDIPLNGMSLPSGAYLYRLEIISAEGIDTDTGRFVKVQ